MKSAFLIGMVVLYSSKAFGWGALGHAAIGEIAERLLTPAAKALVCEVLGAEPLAVAATFPDEVRNDPRYKDFSPYHFFEIVSGTPVADAVKGAEGKKTAHSFISSGAEFIGRNNVPRDQKIIVMRYLVHLVGDVHQPLHVGNGYDMGANLCDVKWKNPITGRTENVNLHSVWDDHAFEWEEKDFNTINKGKPGKYFGYQSIVANVEADTSDAMKAVKADLPNSSKLGAQAWYEEALAMHPKVYKDGITDPRLRPYCKIKDPVTHKYRDGAYDRKKLPTIGETYSREALGLIHQQILKGGHRLAYVLNDIATRFPPANTNGVGCAEAILSPSQLEAQRGPDSSKTGN